MRHVALSDEARLRPVLEVSPGDLGRADAPPSRTGGPESSRAYWRECLAQAGLSDARGVSEDSWLLYADEIVAELAVRNLVTSHLLPILREGPLRVAQVPPLAGGFALVDGGEPVFTPGCCGDLGDLREWVTAAEHDVATPAPVWTGHPSLWVWRDGERLFLREDQEEGYPLAPKTACIRVAVLREAVQLARRETDRFLDRVLQVICDVRELEDPVGLANALVGRPPREALAS
jgi:hypothetical protein